MANKVKSSEFTIKSDLHYIMGGSLTEHSQKAEDRVYDTVGCLGQKVKENLKTTVRAKVTQKLPQGRQQDLVVAQTCQDMKLSFLRYMYNTGKS